MDTNNQIDINNAINNVVEKCQDDQVYSNIMKDLFTNGIENPSICISSLEILPKLNKGQIEKNFKKNINKILTYLKSTIIKSPSLDVYKVLSCIYGAFLGDAMGAFCEFEQPNKENSQTIFKLDTTVIGGLPGQVTDDSEMALSLAYAIMDNPLKEELLVDYIYFYYGAWFKTQPLDFGKTTKNALRDFDFEKDHPHLKTFITREGKIKEDNLSSLSNGFLMRKSPFIAWLYYRFYNELNTAFSSMEDKDILDLYKKIKKLSLPDDICTNPNNQANVGSAIYCLMALMAIKGSTPNLIKHQITNLCSNPNFISIGEDEKIVGNAILYYFQLFNNKDFNLYTTFGDLNSNENVYNNMGYYFHAIKLILYFIEQFDFIEAQSPQKRYRTIMNQICDLGGDTDTNCCIVGAVIGPLIGMSNFGKEFNTMLELIPTDRAIYSVAMILLFVIYLNKSNKDENLVKDDKYFLKQILTMIYGDIELDY